MPGRWQVSGLLFVRGTVQMGGRPPRRECATVRVLKTIGSIKLHDFHVERLAIDPGSQQLQSLSHSRFPPGWRRAGRSYRFRRHPPNLWTVPSRLISTTPPTPCTAINSSHCSTPTTLSAASYRSSDPERSFVTAPRCLAATLLELFARAARKASIPGCARIRRTVFPTEASHAIGAPLPLPSTSDAAQPAP